MVRTISAIISAGLLVIAVAIALFAISLAGRGFGFAEYAQFVALARISHTDFAQSSSLCEVAF